MSGASSFCVASACMCTSGLRYESLLCGTVMTRQWTACPAGIMASKGMYTKPAPLGATHAALCIGNSKYVSSRLNNAAKDAADVAALCTNLGFATEAGVTW